MKYDFDVYCFRHLTSDFLLPTPGSATIFAPELLY
jgi:hypothetical protein